MEKKSGELHKGNDKKRDIQPPVSQTEKHRFMLQSNATGQLKKQAEQIFEGPRCAVLS